MKYKPSILVYHGNPNSTGSVVTRISKTLKSLKSDLKVILICPAEGPLTAACLPHCERLVIHNFTENDKTANYIKAFLKFSALIIKYRPRLLFIPDYSGWKPAELLAAKILRVPIMLSVDFQRHAQDLLGFMRFAKLITANSSATAKVFLDSELKQKTKVIHNSINIPDYPPIERKIHTGKINITYLGVLHPIKGIDVLISAAGILKRAGHNFTLRIGGYEKDPGYQKILEELVLKENLGNDTSFTGRVTDQVSFLKSADILVVPSRHEPFGYVNIEGGACSLPVVASNVGGIPEIIRDGKTGFLFESENSADLAEKLRILIQDPELAIQMGQAAREHVIENFNLRDKIREWHEAVMNLV